MVRAHINIWKDRTRRGIAALEFALTLPIWITLLLGASDGAYCLLVNEKADRIAYTVTDIITQYQTISLANLNDIMLAAQQLMSPVSFNPTTVSAAHPATGYIIVSSVFQPSTGSPIIEWQYTFPPAGPGVTIPASKIGGSSGSAVLPNGLTLNANDNVIISEVYYNFTPMFVNANLFKAGLVYRNAVYKPRLSPLVTPPT